MVHRQTVRTNLQGRHQIRTVTADNGGDRFRIRLAKESDALPLHAAFKAIESDTKRLMIRTPIPEPDELGVQLRNGRASGTHLYLFCYRCDICAGYMRIAQAGGYGSKGRAQFSTAIVPAFRRQGLGIRITEHAIKLASRISIHRMQMLVHPGNSASIGLHQSLGFSIEGRFRDYVWQGESFEDRLMLARII